MDVSSRGSAVTWRVAGEGSCLVVKSGHSLVFRYLDIEVSTQ